ncbi:heterogeneous nuclear ribonucleoprotein 87F-like [Rhopilema esculentum]|uniref:heterogeneous nuclear ribonucleoprotein 87F-like n=1 Tax=Rhopilema esculentum TaxID=499914 RepID=UPI0031D990A1|eukprot:gene10689-19457_t
MGEDGDMLEKEALRKLFVGGLDRNTSDETFRQHFEKYGNIVDLVIIRDKNTQESKGFGFVTFDSSFAVKEALDNRPHVIDERTVEVKRAIPREDNTQTAHQRTKKLFIGGLPANITEDDITNYIHENYAVHGRVEKCDLIRNKETNEVKGFGFLELDNEDMADVIIITEPKPIVAGKKIEIKKCEERGAGGGRGGAAGGMRGRGGRGGSRGGRGGYGSDRGGNQSGGGYWGGVGSNTGGNMYGGYGQGGMYGSSGYGQDYNAAFNNYGSYGGGYGAYDQSAYGQQSFGGAGGRGGGRGGGRYRPY